MSLHSREIFTHFAGDATRTFKDLMGLHRRKLLAQLGGNAPRAGEDLARGGIGRPGTLSSSRFTLRCSAPEEESQDQKKKESTYIGNSKFYALSMK
jgi:hypothetical protein